jgi:hypothetical protein
VRLIDCRMGKGAVRQGSDNGQRKHQRASRSAIPELSPHRCAVEGTFSKPAIYADFEEGVSLMSETRRRWSEDEIAKLKSLAGTLPVIEIAAKLRRSPGAIMVEASKLGLSLRTRPRHLGRSGRNGADESRTQDPNEESIH